MTGIYALWFEESSMVYIGQSSNITRRFNEHIRDLKSNSHYNYKIQDEFNRYGIPEFIILEYCSVLDLDTNEILWMDEFNSITLGLNLVGGGRNARGTLASCSKYSKIQILRTFSLLYNTSLSYKEIEAKTKVKHSTVGGIKNMETHLWLREEYPDKYNIIKTRKTPTKVGVHSHLSLHNKVSILKIFCLLYKTELSYKDIAKKARVSTTLVSNIRGGNHKWLQESYPVEYSLMQNRLVKYTRFLNPKGEEVIISNIAAYVKKHNFDDTVNSRKGLSRVRSGSRKSYKGWTLAK